MRVRDIDPKKDRIYPKCPYCDRKLNEVLRVKGDRSLLTGIKGYCYLCPHCEKILGFADFN